MSDEAPPAPPEGRVKNRIIKTPRARFVRIQHNGAFYYYEIQGKNTSADEEAKGTALPAQPSDGDPDPSTSHPETEIETESQPPPEDPSAPTQEVHPKSRSPVQTPEEPDNQVPQLSQNRQLLQNATEYVLPPRFESGLPLFRRDLGTFVGIQRKL